MSDIITKFLILAKQKTYAGKGARVISCRPCSYDLSYSKGDFSYYDSYFGGEKFVGEEVLWVKNKPFWSMNYAGRVIDENFSGDFLKEALSIPPLDKPFRGPETYSNGEYKYMCEIDGDFEWFTGYEAIFHCGQNIYECNFHGSIIK